MELLEERWGLEEVDWCSHSMSGHCFVLRDVASLHLFSTVVAGELFAVVESVSAGCNCTQEPG